jgi:hypothetical protein
LYFQTFDLAIARVIEDLLKYGVDVDPGRWQGVSTEGRPDMVTKEMMNVALDVRIPPDLETLQKDIKPNLPWAEDHFQERVSGIPSNPGVEYKNWPWWHGQVDDTQEQGVFTHTYQERFWPKWANPPADVSMSDDHPLRGIRYDYGDLNDVVSMLIADPLTRQATFPIFFPEDTGAVHGGRIPCTLHYHFLCRGDVLNLWYPIRSCDAVRHFRDDLYMACRLVHWMLDQLKAADQDYDEPFWDKVTPGFLHFTAYSFHIHKGDMHHVSCV